MTKFGQKQFTVGEYSNYQPNYKCYRCGQKGRYFIVSQLGQLCSECYHEERAKKETEMRGLGDLGKT